MRLKLLSGLFFIAMLALACSDNGDDPINNIPGSNFIDSLGGSVSRNFIGQVVDENNIPISGVAIAIGSSAKQTDANGFFIINAASVKTKFAYITAKKIGYADGSRALVPTEGTNSVKIMLLQESVLTTVNSGATSEAMLPNGSKVTFDGNFKDEAGTAYSGPVDVIMHHLDSSDPNLASKMPGMLFAENAEGRARMLETYGMMRIELRGSAGEKLQITNTAQIEMPILASQLGSAPATIPLWHFDEVNGYWKEEGSATKTGNKYIGTVSHFSWWNCDAPFPTVTLCVTVVNSTGAPISNVTIELIKADNSYPRSGLSDNNGQVCGLIPSNETLTMKIYDNCGNVINTSTIGPFNANTTLPNIVLTTGMVQSTLVQGTLLKCDNTNVTNGYVIMNSGSQVNYAPVTNGAFSFTTLLCSASTGFTLNGFDYDNVQTSGAVNYNFTSPVTNIGNLLTCSAVSEFISYGVDGATPTVAIGDFSTSSQGGSFNINHLSSTGGTQDYISIQGTSTAVGSYTTANGFSFTKSALAPIYINSDVTNDVIFQLNNFGAVGSYIDITFNGTYTDTLSVSHTINGVAHVLRD